LLAALGAAGCAWVAPDSQAAELWLGALLWPAQGLAEGVAWGAARLPARLPDGIGCEFGVAVASALGLVCLRMGCVRSVVLCWLSLLLAGGVPRVDHDLWAERPRVWFFDVGQGDAALFEGRNGSMLIDTGPGPPDGSGGLALVRSLRAVGRDAIDVLVVTHADLDHRGGAVRVLQTLRVAELWLPASGRADPALLDLAAVARAQGTVVSWRSAESPSETRGDLRIATLWPPGLAGPRSRNAGSLVLRVELEGRSFLLMADVDSVIELRLSQALPDRISADFIKVSHHGSRGGTDRAFLEGVGARHAIVSAPCLSSRGLPSRQTLDRIRRSASRLWWTGRDGAVVVFPGRQPGLDEVVSWAVPRRC
jgi:beta-lactamase superfamily II metal-dependent hydrolase